MENYLYKGMIAGLDDAYAAYYTKEEYQSMMDSTNGSYYGIGVEMSQNMTTGIITITRVLRDRPRRRRACFRETSFTRCRIQR